MSHQPPAVALSIFDFPLTDRFDGWTNRDPQQGQCQCPAHDDRKASLSVGLGDGGERLLLRCQAGCHNADVLKSVKATWGDLFIKQRGRRAGGGGRNRLDTEANTIDVGGATGSPSTNGKYPPAGTGNGSTSSKTRASASDRPRIVAEYTYRDANGSPVFQVVRFDPKDFRQRHRAHGSGRWVWKGVAEDRRPLYRLPELLESSPDTVVFLVEGEKDCDRLRASGLVATTACGGADAAKPTNSRAGRGRSKTESSKWLPQYTETLRNRVVVIIPDADEPGRQHARNVAAKLLGFAREVSILDLPIPPGIDPFAKWDVSDWLDAGGTRQQFQEAVSLARTNPVSQSNPATPAAYSDGEPGDLDDAMAAARQIIAESMTIDGRRVVQFWRGDFLRWVDGKYIDQSAESIKAAIWTALDSLGASGISARYVGDVLGALKSLCILSDSQEQPSWVNPEHPVGRARDYIATADGIVNLPKLLAGHAEIIPPTPAFFTRSKLPFSVVGGGARPAVWLDFLQSVWPEGEIAENGCVDTLQEWFGYCLVPDTSLQKMLLIVGPPRSGKGTIVRVLRQIVGDDNCCGPTLSALATNFGISGLLGKTLATISDARISGRTDQATVIERLLSITGEDAQQIERKYCDPITVKLQTRFLLATNELPRLSDASGALSSRMIILPMEKSFLGSEDHALQARLNAELPAIFAWAIEGLGRLWERGRFIQPEAGNSVVEDLDEITSPVRSFLKARCTIGDDQYADRKELYQAWREWAKDVGQRETSEAVFGRDLHSVLPKIKTINRKEFGVRRREYIGLSLNREHSDSNVVQAPWFNDTQIA